MISNWSNFINEFVDNSGNDLIGAKMQELKDLVDGVSSGQNFIYEWENKDDHQLLVNFSTGELSVRYEFDIDDLILKKVVGDTVDFTENVESIDEGLDMIEKDIQLILGVSERYRQQWDSSIKESELVDIIDKIVKITKLEISDNASDIENIIEELEEELSSIYDKIVPETIIDMILFSNPDIINDSTELDKLIGKIIELGDIVMNKYGTEPRQVLNAFNDAFRIISKHFDIDPELVEEKIKTSMKYLKIFENFTNESFDMTKLYDIADEIQNNDILSVENIEGEGKDSLRIDYRGDKSIWLFTSGTVDGNLTPKVKKFLKEKGFSC